MKHIKVLGSGCANCKTTLKLIEEVAQARGVAVNLEKVDDMAAILGYGVMSTPGVVIDGKVVPAGGVPDRKKIGGWLWRRKQRCACLADGSSRSHTVPISNL